MLHPPGLTPADAGRKLASCPDEKPGDRHYRAARNGYLDLTLGEIQDAIGTLRSTTFTIAERPGAAVEEHAGIIDAIAARDRTGAEERARAHIRNALRARLRLIQGT